MLNCHDTLWHCRLSDQKLVISLHAPVSKCCYIALQHFRNRPMLYKIYETQRSFMEPFADFALGQGRFLQW